MLFTDDRGGKVFKQSAPVIKLPQGASEDKHLEVLGVLNSSTACFWLKQNSHGKGNGGIGGGIGDEPEADAGGQPSPRIAQDMEQSFGLTVGGKRQEDVLDAGGDGCHGKEARRDAGRV